MWAAGLLPHFKTAKVPRDAIVMLTTKAGLLPQPQAEGYATLDFRVDISLHFRLLYRISWIPDLGCPTYSMTTPPDSRQSSHV